MMKDTREIDIVRVKGERIRKEKDLVIVEYPFTIFINDEELITLLCSPKSLEFLAVGFLFSEDIISSYADINRMKIDEAKARAYIYMDRPGKIKQKFKGKKTITSGAAKGMIFYDVMDSFQYKKIQKPMEIDIEQIKDLTKKFGEKSELFLTTGGAHSCALCDRDNILIFEEDIGRHNALDKIFGRALMTDINTADKIVLSSGRISSEMLIKTVKRQIPIVISRAAPTSMAIEIARKLDVSLIGFARGDKMNIYSNPTSIKS